MHIHMPTTQILQLTSLYICFMIKRSIHPSFYPPIRFIFGCLSRQDGDISGPRFPSRPETLQAITLEFNFCCELVIFLTYFIFVIYLRALYWHHTFSRFSFVSFAIFLSQVVLIYVFLTLCHLVSFFPFRNSISQVEWSRSLLRTALAW